MKRITLILPALALACANPIGAQAHALLDRATPSVGGTVSGSPSAIELEFTEGVEPRYGRVTVSGPSGAVPVSPAAGASGSPKLSVRLGQRLKPGQYRVTWAVVSVDTHKTQGSFTFTVQP
jgi:methionine-rich copper-binding protein CopC